MPACSFFLFACGKKSNPGNAEPPQKLRVLGYLFSHNNWEADFNSLNLNQITDLNLAFINPDASGNLPSNEVFKTIVNKAHSKQARVFFSIGGGDPPAHLAGLLLPVGTPTRFPTPP